MAQVADPLDLASILLTKTETILGRMEERWCRTAQSEYSPKPSDSDCNFGQETGFEINEINEELKSYQLLTGRTLTTKGNENSNLLSGIVRLEKNDAVDIEDEKTANSRPFIQPTSEPVPSTRVLSSGKDLNENVDQPLYTDSTRRSHNKNQRLNAWKVELNNKISKLEQELEDLRLMHLQEKARKGHSAELDVQKLGDNFMLLDIISSQSSSPVKNPSREMGKTFRKVSVGVENTITTRKEEVIKERLMETERIMNRGLKTARELNEKLDLLKKKSPRRKDVSLQVAIPDKASSSNDESHIYDLVENVTSLLLQLGKDEGEGDRSSVQTPRFMKNTRHLVVSHKDGRSPAQSVGPRLVVQRLPDNAIKGALSVQQLPSIHIMPSSKGVFVNSGNIKVCDVEHPLSPAQKPCSSDSVASVIRKAKFCPEREKSSKELSSRAEIGLQVDMSLSSKSEIPIQERIEFLAKKFKDKKKLMQGLSESHKLGDLFRKVQESAQLCQRYSHRSLPREMPSASHLRFSPADKSTMASRKSSIPEPELEETQGPSLRISDAEEGSYKSDFEVPSIVLDGSRNNSSHSDIILEKRISETPKQINHRFSVSAVLSTPRSQPDINASSHSQSEEAAFPLDQWKILKMDSNRSNDESLIEEQMKRLGLSPERVESPWRVSQRPKKSKLGSRINSSCGHHLRNQQEILSRELSPNYKAFYVKSDGKFIPVDPLQAPKVQIIVPEIVVKLPETHPSIAGRHVANLASPSPNQGVLESRNKQDQVVQTDEGCGTLTSGEASSVMEKINKHFERTQLLLDRMNVKSNEAPVGNGFLELLHKRYRGEENRSQTSAQHTRKNLSNSSSPGEVTSCLLTEKRRKNEIGSQSVTSRSEGEVIPDENSASDGQSIGEIRRYEYR